MRKTKRLVMSGIGISAVMSAFCVLAALYHRDAAETAPIPVDSWAYSSGINSDSTRIDLKDDTTIEVLCEYVNDQHRLSLLKLGPGHIYWNHVLVECRTSVYYSISYDVKNNYLIQLFIKWNSGAGGNSLLVMPYNEVLSRSITLPNYDKACAANKDDYLFSVCSILINRFGEVYAVHAHPYFAVTEQCQIDFSVCRQANTMNNEISIARHKNQVKQDWSVSLSGVDDLDTISLHPLTCNETILIAVFSQTLTLSGNVLFEVRPVPAAGYMAIIELDGNGNSCWHRVVGPIDVGSESTLDSCMASPDSIYITATYSKNMSYWDERSRYDIKKLTGPDFCDRVFYRINHSQCLLLVNDVGALQFAGKLADGYLQVIALQIMPDNRLGVYAEIGARLRLLERDQSYRLWETHSADEDYTHIFITLDDDLADFTTAG